MEKDLASSRNTRQKFLILDCIRNNAKRHLTAEEITDILKQNQTPVAKSTVYRFLTQLEIAGEVRRYALKDSQSACYQYIDKNSSCCEHYHMMCKCCGQVLHFENRELQSLFEKINLTPTENGFALDGKRTVFYGMCMRCSTEKV